MSDHDLSAAESRARAWMENVHRASANYACGVEGAARIIRTAAEQDAERTAEINYLEALWKLPSE